MQLLTATVKLFLKKPTESAQKMISAVLSCATTETDNPDLRDRAYIYWRLLSTDPEVLYRACPRHLTEAARGLGCSLGTEGAWGLTGLGANKDVFNSLILPRCI